MTRFRFGAAAAAIIVSLAACSESATDTGTTTTLSGAFVSQLAGFGNTHNSFSASADSMAPWGPGDHHEGGFGGGHHGDRDGHHGGRGDHDLLFGGLMGGGLGDLFRGFGFGAGFGHGRHGDLSLGDCTFDAASGRQVCPTETHDGVTIDRSVAFADASGTVQQAFDSITTNRINLRVSVSGTLTRRDGAISTIAHNSDRTVTGLASGSTQHTVNGTSAGRESTSGQDSAGTFTVLRTMGDTIVNVVIPARVAGSTTPVYPTAGTVIRSMSAAVTHAGTTTTTARREVITYDGSSTARVTITQDGSTKSCTIALPHGRLTCS